MSDGAAGSEAGQAEEGFGDACPLCGALVGQRPHLTAARRRRRPEHYAGRFTPEEEDFLLEVFAVADHRFPWGYPYRSALRLCLTADEVGAPDGWTIAYGEGRA